MRLPRGVKKACKSIAAGQPRKTKMMRYVERQIKRFVIYPYIGVKYFTRHFIPLTACVLHNRSIIQQKNENRKFTHRRLGRRDW